MPYRRTLVNWKQRYSSISEELDFFRFENSMKFSLSKFHLLCKCKASVKMSMTPNTIPENLDILNFIELRAEKIKFFKIIAVTLLPVV